MHPIHHRGLHGMGLPPSLWQLLRGSCCCLCGKTSLVAISAEAIGTTSASVPKRANTFTTTGSARDIISSLTALEALIATTVLLLLLRFSGYVPRCRPQLLAGWVDCSRTGCIGRTTGPEHKVCACITNIADKPCCMYGSCAPPNKVNPHIWTSLAVYAPSALPNGVKQTLRRNLAVCTAAAFQ